MKALRPEDADKSISGAQHISVKGILGPGTGMTQACGCDEFLAVNKRETPLSALSVNLLINVDDDKTPFHNVSFVFLKLILLQQFIAAHFAHQDQYKLSIERPNPCHTLPVSRPRLDHVAYTLQKYDGFSFDRKCSCQRQH